jgi:paraquat-inducible protein B
MSDQHQPHQPHQPRAVLRSQLDRRRRLSLIWAIPIVAVLIGGWLAWRTLAERGPLITITFESASGLTAGQSHVRHKDVDMGLVERIALSKDLQHVVVTVRMNREAEPFLTDKAQFWIVKPRFFAGAVTGLETLVSGSYIELQPSVVDGQPTHEFTGLETPPVLTSDVPGHTFLLQAARLGNISLGSPVSFRDLDVGEVLGWDLGNMAETVTVHAFVRAPYDAYVHDNSRFWNDSGAKVTLGPNGLQLQVDSLRAVLLGGIAFDTPKQGRGFPKSAENHVFPLYDDQEAADTAGFTRRLQFLAKFQSSVAGLSPTAAVTLHGIKIGEVSSVGLKYDKSLDSVVAPVEFAVEPDRIAELNLPSGGDLDAAIAELVHRGLRVRLDSTSLITGQKQLAMDIYPDSPPATLTKQGDTYIIPVVPGGSEDIVASAGALMAKLDAIPFQQIGDNLGKALAGFNGMMNGPDLQQSLVSLHATLADADTLVQRLNTATGPLPQKLPEIINELDSASKRLNGLVASVQSGYGGNSDFSRDASRLLVQLSDTARSFRVLADLLTRHPEALIRGRTDQSSP